jgi:hypothetical protein
VGRATRVREHHTLTHQLISRFSSHVGRPRAFTPLLNRDTHFSFNARQEERERRAVRVYNNMCYRAYNLGKNHQRPLSTRTVLERVAKPLTDFCQLPKSLNLECRNRSKGSKGGSPSIDQHFGNAVIRLAR